MGASSWNAWVPYRGDLEAALQQARQDTYDRGAFYRAEPDIKARLMSEEEYVARELAEMRNSLPDEFGDDGWEPDETFARDGWRAAQVEVTGPDTLLQAQPFSGTHSIIDMTGVAESPEIGKVAPIPAQTLDEVFDTRQPTSVAVERAISDNMITDFGRDHGAYIVAYDGDQPDVIYFLGHSGD